MFLNLDRFLPFTDLRGYAPRDAARDGLSAIAVTIMAVPQGVAYAVIAGLPPMMGLYAAAIPTIVGSLFRSSRHVITGPTNAVSLLVAGGVAAMSGSVEPLQFGIALALLVGLFQFFAGVFRLGALVDYISNPVVLGYITGAGLLIGIGQLPNVTGTEGGGRNAFEKIAMWVDHLPAARPMPIAIALGTAALIFGLRAMKPKWPNAIIGLGLATLVSWVFDLPSLGVRTVADLTPVPRGFPDLTVPDVTLFPELVGIAIAATVLSLVESSAVARSIATRTGQRLDTSAEFAGQGLANIVAGFFGAYPTSGSLSRSALNEESGGVSRMSGVFTGLMMLLVLLVLGPVVNETPVAALAGLLIVVAIGLVDIRRIVLTLKSPWADTFAFVGTLIGTWALPLDEAIYLGVGITIVLFLRKARLLVTHELAIDADNRLHELPDDPDDSAAVHDTCSAIKILHVEGHLFFGVAGELEEAIENAVTEEVRVLILRLKRTQGIDVTVATSITETAQRLDNQGRHLLLAGVREEVMDVLDQTELADDIRRTHIFETRSKWFASMREAVDYAIDLVEAEHGCRDDCPIHRYLDEHEFLEPDSQVEDIM